MKKATILTGLLSLGLTISPTAWANKAIKNAETNLKKTCGKEHPEAAKGKTTDEIAKWVESEEHGPQADAFKKSKCFAAYEQLENAKHEEEPTTK